MGRGFSMMRCMVLAVAVAVLVTGCGAGDGSPAGESSPSATGTAPTSYDTAAQLAAAVGCSGFELDTRGQRYVNELGSCILDGTALYLCVFADNRQRAQWRKAARKAAGVVLVQGDRWVVQAVTAEAAKRVAGATGGEVQR